MSDDQNFEDIEVKPTALDICINALTVLVCAATWGLLIFSFVFHEIFPDVFRSPGIFAFFAYAAVNYLVFSWLTKALPNHPFSESIKITKENAECQYRLNARHNRWMRLSFTALISWSMIGTNLIRTDTVDDWHATVGWGIIIVMCVIALYYYVRARMLK